MKPGTIVVECVFAVYLIAKYVGFALLVFVAMMGLAVAMQYIGSIL